MGDVDSGGGHKGWEGNDEHSCFILSFVVNLKNKSVEKQKTLIPVKYVRASHGRQNEFIKRSFILPSKGVADRKRGRVCDGKYGGVWLKKMLPHLFPFAQPP